MSNVGWEIEHSLRRFADARARGDREAMFACWEGIVTASWDHLRAAVAIAGARILSADERDEALSEAAWRLSTRLVWTFDGSTAAELRAALRTVASISCRDVQRKAAKRSARTSPLDAPATGDEGPSTTDRVDAAIDAARRAMDEERERERELMREAGGFLDWALPRLSDRRRAVIELLRRGSSREDVMTRLDMERNNVDQTYRRALQDLIQLKEQYPS